MHFFTKQLSHWYLVVVWLFYVYLSMRDNYDLFRFSALHPEDSKFEHALVFTLFSPYIYFDDLLFREPSEVVCTATPRILCITEQAQQLYYAMEELPKNLIPVLIPLLTVKLWFAYMAFTFKPAIMTITALWKWMNKPREVKKEN